MAEHGTGGHSGDVPNAIGSDTSGLPSLPPLFVPSAPPPATAAVSPQPIPDADFVWTPPSSSRNPRRFAISAALLIVLVGAIAGGWAVAGNDGPPAAPMLSPAEANASLYAAARSSGSFHYIVTSSGSIAGNVLTQTQSGDVGPNEGTQFSTSNAGDYEVMVINSVAYMRADMPTLQNNFGYSSSEAAPYVNRWIAFIPSDGPYPSIAADVTTGSTWGNPANSPTDELPHTPLSVSPVSTLNGRSVQSVTYSMHGVSSMAKGTFLGTEQIYFAAVGPRLPYYLTEQLSGTVNQQQTTGTTRVTFNHWGETVNLTPPPGAVPYSSLPPPSTTA